VTEKVAELKIKPTKVFKKKKYFGEDIVEKLAGLAVYEKKRAAAEKEDQKKGDD
jgi:hypothetical protein